MDDIQRHGPGLALALALTLAFDSADAEGEAPDNAKGVGGGFAAAAGEELAAGTPRPPRHHASGFWL